MCPVHPMCWIPTPGKWMAECTRTRFWVAPIQYQTGLSPRQKNHTSHCIRRWKVWSLMLPHRSLLQRINRAISLKVSFLLWVTQTKMITIRFRFCYPVKTLVKSEWDFSSVAIKPCSGCKYVRLTRPSTNALSWPFLEDQSTLKRRGRPLLFFHHDLFVVFFFFRMCIKIFLTFQ